MTNFAITFESENYQLDIETSNIDILDGDLGYAMIEINEQNNSIILESSTIEYINNLEIEKYNDYDLVLTNTVYANLPDEIPMSIITGNLDVSRIDGLDNYLTTIPVDGGSP